MTRKRTKSPLKTLQRGVEYGAFLVVDNIIRLFSIAAIWRTGARLSTLGHLFASRRSIVRSNLRTVLGREPREQELTRREREARELIRYFDDPSYAVPEALQSGKNWRPISLDENLPPAERWLDACRSPGMHDPPLEWTYA